MKTLSKRPGFQADYHTSQADPWRIGQLAPFISFKWLDLSDTETRDFLFDAFGEGATIGDFIGPGTNQPISFTRHELCHIFKSVRRYSVSATLDTAGPNYTTLHFGGNYFNPDNALFYALKDSHQRIYNFTKFYDEHKTLGAFDSDRIDPVINPDSTATFKLGNFGYRYEGRYYPTMVGAVTGEGGTQSSAKGSPTGYIETGTLTVHGRDTPLYSVEPGEGEDPPAGDMEVTVETEF